MNEDSLDFDWDHWVQKFPWAESVHQTWFGGHGATPQELCYYQQYQDSLLAQGYELGPGVPVDVFALGHGEHPARSITRIGGLPYYPKEEAWPISSGGKPLMFLCQFRFRESQDFLGELPGDVLLVFTEPEYIGGETRAEFRFIWKNLGDPYTDLVQKGDVPPEARHRLSFFGLRHRSKDHPGQQAFEEAMRICRDHPHELDSYPMEKAAWDICLTDGLKIGGAPRYQYNSRKSQGKYLGCLSTFYPSFDTPWPWVNREEPYPVEVVYDDSLRLDMSGGFRLHFYLEQDGTVTHEQTG